MGFLPPTNTTARIHRSGAKKGAVLIGDDRIWPGWFRAIFYTFISAGRALENQRAAGDLLKPPAIDQAQFHAAQSRITSKDPD